MTPAEWAAKLNGREYTRETTATERALAKSDQVVIIYGASDDLVEICGAVDEEIGAYDGTTFLIDSDGHIMADSLRDGDYAADDRRHIHATWCPKDSSGDIWASWVYETLIPHSTFDIMEDGEVYCRGIVFALADLA